MSVGFHPADHLSRYKKGAAVNGPIATGLVPRGNCYTKDRSRGPARAWCQQGHSDIATTQVHTHVTDDPCPDPPGTGWLPWSQQSPRCDSRGLCFASLKLVNNRSTADLKSNRTLCYQADTNSLLRGVSGVCYEVLLRTSLPAPTDARALHRSLSDRCQTMPSYIPRDQKKLDQELGQRYPVLKFIRFSEFHPVVHLAFSENPKSTTCGRPLPSSHIQTTNGYRVCHQCYGPVQT